MPQTQKKSRRNKLLALAHIAPKELGISDEDMRMILQREFKKQSRADLSEMELGYLIDWFRQHGWQGSSKLIAHSSKEGQVNILRTRAYEIAGQIENGEQRLKGLVRKILDVDSIAWSRDVGKLRRLLAVLEKIKEKAIWD